MAGKPCISRPTSSSNYQLTSEMHILEHGTWNIQRASIFKFADLPGLVGSGLGAIALQEMTGLDRISNSQG